MSQFIKSVQQMCNTAYTENGAVSYASTNDALLDFFSKVGGMRGQNQEAFALFVKAYAENPLFSVRCLFHVRDIREGMGEREIFRYIIQQLADDKSCQEYHDMAKFMFGHINEYGRWDDYYAYFGTHLQNDAIKVLKTQFDKDLKNLEQNNVQDKKESISLLGKWLKSENTSSHKSVKLARDTRKGFKLSSQEYRKKLSKLRKHIEVVECAMATKRWDEIDYEGVPSLAMKNYSKAFKKHDSERYLEYLESVKAGTKTINSSVLYPYDLYVQSRSCCDPAERERINLQWNNLPNYFTKKEHNILPILDVSGSMKWGSDYVPPISVAISLGLYIAERNTGQFKDHYMTFNEHPKLCKIQGNDVCEKMTKMKQYDNQYCSTNLIAVFEVLLNAIKKDNIPADQVPKQLIIISDMQFNDVGGYSTNLEHINQMYRDAGIDRPNITFWNVSARSDNPATKDSNNTFLISGRSPSILKHALNTTIDNPQELMLEVLSSPRYSNINYVYKSEQI